MELVHDRCGYYNEQNPLEVQIIRNISSVELGKTTIWSSFIVIDPLEGYIDSPRKEGQVRGFLTPNNHPTFTQVFNEDDEVVFKLRPEGFGKQPEPGHFYNVGELKVGDTVYRVNGDISPTMARKNIIHEVKKFPNAYDGVRRYLEVTYSLDLPKYIPSEKLKGLIETYYFLKSKGLHHLLLL